MKKIILINSIHHEEKRVAIIEGDLLVDFYVEVSSKEQLKGNIYKGIISRIEPGIQAVFVDFGPKKHGFLQIKEIKPEYFRNREEGKKARVQDVLLKGQELIVQVEKDERNTKGASLTTYISIPGRYIVMMPGQKRIGISRKIEAKEDRDRLKKIIDSLKLPQDMGFIFRTACSDKTSRDLLYDLKYLNKLWNTIQNTAKEVSAPALIYKEHDFAVRTVRDYLSSDVNEVFVDNTEAYSKMKNFLRKTIPWRRIRIKHYKDKKPIFSKHNIEEQISKIYERYVHLPSKGYLVIDSTEALTAVDINSGRSRKEENVESTALKTNLEAADEIARQLRLRDIGGLIVIDFIDMESFENRKAVENRITKALSSDKAHTEISSISKFGLLEMTRERMRPAYFESINKKCEMCDGTGLIKTDEMIAVSALRDMHTKASRGGLKTIICRLSADSANYLINRKRNEISALETEFDVKIHIFADKDLMPGQFNVETAKIKPESKDIHHEKMKAQ